MVSSGLDLQNAAIPSGTIPWSSARISVSGGVGSIRFDVVVFQEPGAAAGFLVVGERNSYRNNSSTRITTDIIRAAQCLYMLPYCSQPQASRPGGRMAK